MLSEECGCNYSHQSILSDDVKHLKYETALEKHRNQWKGVQRDTDKIGLFASFQDSPSFPQQIKAEIAICLAVCFE